MIDGVVGRGCQRLDTSNKELLKKGRGGRGYLEF